MAHSKVDLKEGGKNQIFFFITLKVTILTGMEEKSKKG